jgi:hypothetical protein
MIGDKKQRSNNNLKKKNIKSTRSKSSTEEEFPEYESQKYYGEMKDHLDIVQEEPKPLNNFNLDQASDTKNTKRKSTRNKSNGCFRIENTLNEKESKASINLKNQSSKKYEKNSMKISEVSEMSIVDPIDNYTLILSDNTSTLSPKTEQNVRQASTSETLKEAQSLGLLSNSKMEEINSIQPSKTSEMFDSNNIYDTVRALSFSNEQLRPRIDIFVLDYSQEQVDEIYNLDENLNFEENILSSIRNSNYFENQVNVNHRMRTILIDWVMEVCGQLSFKRATYHLAVVLIDIFLSKVENLPTNLLQLTGVSCLIIAAKNEVN